MEPTHVANTMISTSNGCVTSVIFTDLLKQKAIEDLKTFGLELVKGKPTSLSTQDLNVCLFYLQQFYWEQLWEYRSQRNFR